jgi:hypothetical protein
MEKTSIHTIKSTMADSGIVRDGLASDGHMEFIRCLLPFQEPQSTGEVPAIIAVDKNE